MPKSRQKKSKPVVPAIGKGDYTKIREQWNPTEEELIARLKERSRQMKKQRRKAS